MNYTAFQAIAVTQIKAAGLPVSFTRAGAPFASSHAFQKESKQADDSNALLAQTAVTTRTFVVAPTTAPLQAGDLMLTELDTYTVKSLKEIKPAGVLILTEVEVV